MSTSLEISLVDARFHAFHGVMPQEREVGNEYAVDVTVGLPVPDTTEEACLSDEISDTVSYADLYELVKQRMAVPCNLLEYLASKITDDIRTRWPELSRVQVRVTKLAPPIPNSLCRASVTLSWCK